MSFGIIGVRAGSWSLPSINLGRPTYQYGQSSTSSLFKYTQKASL